MQAIGEVQASRKKAGGVGDPKKAPSQDPSKMVHVIVSPAEHAAISKLYERYDTCASLVKTLENSFETLEENGNKCVKDVNNKLDAVVSQLNTYKNDLIQDLEKVKETKKKKLSEQLKTLMAYRAEIADV